MTKDQWIELINLKLSGGDAPANIQGKYSPQEIELYANMAFDDMQKMAWVESPDLLTDYIKGGKYSIKYDANRDERYIDLNIQVLQLPNNSGIVQVRQPKNPYLTFAIIDSNASPVFEYLEVSKIDNKVGVYNEGSRLYFDDKLPKIVDEVFVKVITTFASLDGDDEVSVPGGNNVIVFDTIYKLMGKTNPSVNQENMVDKQV